MEFEWIWLMLIRFDFWQKRPCGGTLGSCWVGEFRYKMTLAPGHLEDMVKKFGAVYYNFPHAGVVQGFFDGHPFVRILANNERRLWHIPRLGTDFPTIGPVVFLGVTIVAAAKNMLFALFFKAALLQCVVIVGLLSFQCLMCSTLAVKSSLQLQLLCSTMFHSFWMLHSYPHRIFTLRHNLVHSWDILGYPTGSVGLKWGWRHENLMHLFFRVLALSAGAWPIGHADFTALQRSIPISISPPKERRLIRSLHWKTPLKILKILKTLEEPHVPSVSKNFPDLMVLNLWRPWPHGIPWPHGQGLAWFREAWWPSEGLFQLLRQRMGWFRCIRCIR